VRDFSTRAQAAGVDVQLSVYDDMVHVWHLLGSATPKAQQGIDEIAAFTRKHVH
jgi:acetyl esterase/lipase